MLFSFSFIFPSFFLFISIYLFLTTHSTLPKSLKAHLLHRLVSSWVSPVFLREGTVLSGTLPDALATHCCHLQSTRGPSLPEAGSQNLPNPPVCDQILPTEASIPTDKHSSRLSCPTACLSSTDCSSVLRLFILVETHSISVSYSIISVTPRPKPAQTGPLIALDCLTSPLAVWKA